MRPEVAPALDAILKGQPVIPVPPAVWTDVAAFYGTRSGEPAWLDEQREPAIERATNALTLLHTKAAQGLGAIDYGEARIIELPPLIKMLDKRSRERGERLAELDVRLTTAMLAFGRDVAIGGAGPETVDLRWKSRRTPPDFVATLNTAVNGDLSSWVEAIRPPHPEYVALQQALAGVEAQQAKGGWTHVPAPLQPGSSSAMVVALRQRLAESGELKRNAANASRTYDDDVVAGVRNFQMLHGVNGTGVLDPTTLAAMNVPIEDRMAQIRVNLERWRWMPDDFGARHLMVNIPSFRLVASEGGRPVLDIRVIVGKPGNETPIFSDEMATVVFSPYWTIPETIVASETAPAARRDRGYLARNNIEVLRMSRKQATTLDADEVDWDDPAKVRGLTFRQRPGAQNALGLVKFLFPNPYGVYLHDTPADALFSRQRRAFSHGCVRVELPEKLAHYVLRDDARWDIARVNAAMRSGVEKHVRLKDRIPVHIVYFTAWVDGGLHLHPDVYGYDRRQFVAELKNR